ncbi:MAG: hypothetical protein H6739_18155 [Alphaproteobacteria bacterium]|nr:hypothetical protein [Alphaproteobacteria bacterium]
MGRFLVLSLLTTGLFVGQAAAQQCAVDEDDDGYVSAAACPNGTDCDDTDPDTHPFATEIPNDGIDQDCSGEDLVSVCDSDSDGYEAYACGGLDCDDDDPDINPDGLEIDGDGIDQDCDGWDYCEAIEWVQGGLECAAAPDVDPSGYGWLIAAGLLGLARRRRGA